MNASTLTLLLVILTSSLPASGENGATQTSASTNAASRYIHDQWTTDNGLPQNTVTALVQTRDGYLWLGTSGGLVRFDGARFTVFDVGNTEGLRSNRIQALCEDRQGDLWIGTEDGGLTRYTQGRFIACVLDQYPPNADIACIVEDSEGSLWILMADELLRLKDGRLLHFPAPDKLLNRPTWAMAAGRHGDLWISTADGLVRWADNHFQSYTARDGLPHNEVRSVYEDRDGQLWVSTKGGLARFDGQQFIKHSVINKATTSLVGCIAGDREGNLLVSTEDGGVSRFRDGNWQSLTAKGGLSDNIVRSIIEDREGNLWIGTSSAGLHRLKKNKVIAYGTDEGMPEYSVVPVTEDAEGSIWVGATCGGLVRFRSGAVTSYTEKDGLPNLCIWALRTDRDGSLWIGTWGGGLTQFKGGRFKTYNHANSGLSGDAVVAIYEDRNGVLWVGTAGGGLNRFEDGTFTIYRASDGLVNDDVRFITEDSEGALWVGTTGGMSRFYEGRFTNYTTGDGLSHNYVREIYEDPDGTLWVGTYGGGLNRLKAGRFKSIVRKNGLFDDVVSRILEDAGGNLWMSGNRGIFRASRRELNDFADGKIDSINSISYGVPEGMKSNECNGGGQPAGWRARSGELWFPTARGVVMIDPNRIKANDLPPPVAIEQVLIDQRPFDMRQAVEAPPGKGDLEIHYTGLSFVAPEKVRFKYRLEGYDENWIEADTRRIAYYTNIPPGSYRIRIIASNNDGVWNETGAALEFRLRPHFYQTTWFYALAAITLVGTLAYAYRRRITSLRRRHAAQQAFSKQLIESQENDRKRIAAELHDSLGQSLAIIKNRALFGLNAPINEDQAREQFNQIASYSTQAIDEVKEIAYNLRPYLLDRLGLTKAIESMLNKVADSATIRMTCEIDQIDKLFTDEQEINFYRIIQESLNNIIKHSGASQAGVAIKKDTTHLEIVIRDNGKGFTPEAIEASESRKGGFGLIGIAERARILGGKPQIDSAPGRGTIIKLRLPLRDGEKGDEA